MKPIAVIFSAVQFLNEANKSWELVVEKLSGWLDSAITMLPNFVIAILILILFRILAQIVRKVGMKTFPSFMENEAVIRLIVSLIYFLIIAIGLFVALSVLKLDKAVTSLLAGLGVVGLALGFAFQTAASNLLSGVIMAVNSPINVGDIIEVDGYQGAVKEIGLRTTVLSTPQGQNIVIPNSHVLQNNYTHYTVNGVRRIDLAVGISYGDDLEKVEKITIKAIEQLPYLLKDQKVELFYTGFGDSSINFVVVYWIEFKQIGQFFKAQSDGIKAVKKAYDANDITIPFPIRTLDFGIKGGEKLSEVFPANNTN